VSTVLVVCTGNICRSPMAEGILRSLLAERGAQDVDVASAGVSGLEGYPAMPEAVEAMSEKGIDIASHVARRLDPEMVRSADLVLAMSTEHAEAAARMVPGASGRTFTLKELVKLLAGEPAPGRLDEAVRTAALRRSAREGPDSADMDVADPLGLGVQAYRATAWELGELCARLLDEVFGEPDPMGAGWPAGAEGGRPE
jgi:protein-tyrosine phosphatase